jgi:predicted DNA-binding transcriptional regulator YafY
MRADRLVAALLVLQARGRITAEELATELEVSTRTARRDLEGLAMAGIPVYSQPGRGGGWSLVGGSRTDLSGLTAAEARTLFLVAGPSAATPEVKTALRKLVQALPSTFRSDAEAAAGAVVLDPAGWDYTPPSPPRHLEALQQAVIDAVQVRLGYARRDGERSERAVHPLGLVVKNQVWYLIARTDAGQRTFRVSRVRSVEQTGEVVQRPEGFDLAAAWRAIVTTLDTQRAPAAVHVRADAETIGIMRYMFGSRVIEGVTHADGRIDAEIRGHSDELIARQLSGLAGGFEVLSPDSVRAHLADIGRTLVRHYGADSSGAPSPAGPASPGAARSAGGDG